MIHYYIKASYNLLKKFEKSLIKSEKAIQNSSYLLKAFYLFYILFLKTYNNNNENG